MRTASALLNVVVFAAALSAIPTHAQAPEDIARVFDSVGAVYDVAILIEEHRREHGALPKAANVRELSQVRFKNDLLVEHATDGWKTPLHIESAPGNGYLVVAAGADGTFNRASWSASGDTHSAADDVVLRDGVLVRSPVAWATATAGTARELASGAGEALDVSRHQRSVASLRSIASEVLTYQVINNRLPAVKTIDALAQTLGSQIPLTDGWDRRFHVTSDGRRWLLVSAGADGKLDAKSWTNPAVTSDDIVLRDGEVVANETPRATSTKGRLAEAIAGYQTLRARFEKMRK